jgi:hypothetical protein
LHVPDFVFSGNFAGEILRRRSGSRQLACLAVARWYGALRGSPLLTAQVVLGLSRRCAATRCLSTTSSPLGFSRSLAFAFHDFSYICLLVSGSDAPCNFRRISSKRCGDCSFSILFSSRSRLSSDLNNSVTLLSLKEPSFYPEKLKLKTARFIKR